MHIWFDACESNRKWLQYIFVKVFASIFEQVYDCEVVILQGENLGCANMQACSW